MLFANIGTEIIIFLHYIYCCLIYFYWVSLYSLCKCNKNILRCKDVDVSNGQSYRNAALPPHGP